MVLRARCGDQPITLSLKPGSLTVALSPQTVLAFDAAGRLWSYYTHGHHFRRGLNGRVLAKWHSDGARQRRWLSASEADLVVRRAALTMRHLRSCLVLDAPPDISSTWQSWLARAAAFDVAAAHADVARYHQVYQPIGILPPDQYMALVIQVTEGCAFNTCTFCSFYKGRPFRIKSPEALREHIAAVRAYLGDALAMRRRVFLADANALVVPQRALLALLDVVEAEMGPGWPLYAFLDGFSGRKKGAEEYRALAARGLRRVYIGLESGHDPLLRWLRKPGCAADALAAVRQMKAGGVAVGVIVLLGAGGRRYAAGHVRDTIALLNEMGLGEGDLLYFSEFVPCGTPYEMQVDAPDLEPLPPPEMQRQRQGIVSGLRFGATRPTIATYDIREFVY